MQNLVNKKTDKWLRPWDVEKHDNTFYEDDRFFSILVKGALSWLTRNIVMYGKPIKHFIFSTGSSYMYVENNGYEYSTNVVSGEDQLYMTMPRCVVEMDGVSIPTDELTQPYVRGTYERNVNGSLTGMNAEVRRLPVEMTLKLRYVLSNYNESVVLMEEVMSKLMFTKYFSISYLGNIIKCSIDFPTDQSIEVNKIDMTSSDTNQKSIEFSLKITTSYPQFDELTEMRNDQVIGNYGVGVYLHRDMHDDPTDTDIHNI